MDNLTENQSKIYNCLKDKFNGSAFPEEMSIELPEMSIQAIRVVSTSLVRKGICSKEKAIYEDKEKTKYTII